MFATRFSRTLKVSDHIELNGSVNTKIEKELFFVVVFKELEAATTTNQFLTLACNLY